MSGIETIKHTILALVLILAFVAVGVSPTVSADGKDSPEACLDTTAGVQGSKEGTDNKVTVDVGAGNIVAGVCIKSGNESFGDSKHSGVITSDGTYEDCYKVEGIGTQKVTVTRVDSEECKDISHIDVIVTQPDEEEKPTPDDKEEGNVLGASQVTQPPVGGVGAGVGSTGIAALSIVGLVGSLGALSYGVVQLRKNK